MTMQSSQREISDLTTPAPRPRSTYRLQFHKGFTFQDAATIVPYLASLGISHVYASPYLQATPGSTHGYDVVNPEALNPECGSEEDYREFLDALDRHGMSHILDIVPNHMGVGTDQNPWWNDVLEYGLSSPFSQFFDISWESETSDTRERVVLPILGDEPAAVVSRGEIILVFDDQGFGLKYYDRRLPVTPSSYHMIVSEVRSDLPAESGLEHYREAKRIKDELIAKGLSKSVEESLARANGDTNLVRKLLDAQHYRLVFWRDAMSSMNYRRFFDINDLAAVRVERDEVFERTHGSILQRLARGEISGVRVDHPDGLADPRRYFERLQTAYARERAKLLAPTLARRIGVDSAIHEKPLYVVAEKILAFDETLDQSWPIDGTTGYDFLAKINAFMVNPKGEAALSSLYRDFTGCSEDFASVALESKRFVLKSSFSCELETLARRVERVARHILQDHCPSYGELHEAVAELIVHFPVYRTYFTDGTASTDDRARVDEATSSLQNQQPPLNERAVSFLRDLLLDEGEFAAQPIFHKQRWPVVRRFQQLTSPVTAKGVEDTAMYRFHRLISLNEVGCEPDHFGLSADQLHRVLQDRQAHWPNALSTLSTHDTKRSEDIRARLHVLADIPQRFREAVFHWARLNAGKDAIDANTEYLIYQTVLGAWLPGMGQPDEFFISRIVAYMQKAIREAKLFTTWTDPAAEYESRVEQFVRRILDGRASAEFLSHFIPFAKSLARIGYVNSLSQSLLKFTAPGVPDTYQGTELWDFSLVDPDNRRPVDYDVRTDMLHAGALSLNDMLAHPDDGQLKLHLTRACLAARNDFAECFQSGSYEPISIEGECSQNFFAFSRRHRKTSIIAVIPRFPGEWMPFHPDAPLRLPTELTQTVRFITDPGAKFRNLLTSDPVGTDANGHLRAGEIVSQLPIALLLRES